MKLKTFSPILLILTIPFSLLAINMEQLYKNEAPSWNDKIILLRQKIKEHQKDSLQIKIGNWYATPVLISPYFRTTHYPEIKIDLEQKINKKSAWIKRPNWKDGCIIDFSPRIVNSCVYLYRKIETNTNVKLKISLGSDDCFHLWLNKKLIAAKQVYRGARPDQELITLNLKKGTNHLLFKVTNKNGGSGFYFKFLNAGIYAYISKKLQKDYPKETNWLIQDSCSVLERETKKYDIDQILIGLLKDNNTTKIQKLVHTAIKSFPQDQQLNQQLQQLQKSKNSQTNHAEWLKMYVKICKARRKYILQPLLNKCTEIVFAKHQVFGSRSGIYLITETEGCEAPSSLYKIDLTPETKNKYAKTSILFDGKEGIIRDPELSYDAKRLLFAWRQTREHISTKTLTDAPETGNYQIYEMELATGKIRQLTFDNTYGANFEPCYLPNDDIIFSSARIVQHITCGWGDCSNLFLMNKDGKYARRIGFDQVNTAFPTVMPDGRVIYTRRDYNDRGQSAAHALFQMAVDGTGQTELYGNQTGTPNSFQHSRGIPGTKKILTIIGGYHTTQGGKIAIMDPFKGRQKSDGLIQYPENITPPCGDSYNDQYGKKGLQYSNPYPITEKTFLVSSSTSIINGYKLYFMWADGRRELLAADPTINCMQAIPIIKRKKPVTRPSLVDYRKKDAVVFLQNAYFGPASKRIKPGSIKKLRVVEILYKNSTIGWGMGGGPGGKRHTVTNSGHPLASFDAKKIIGDATVYPDGSAMFKIPANTPVYFQLLDENNRVIQFMRSWATLMPGENLSCVGCHEDKNDTPMITGVTNLMAMKHGVEELKPFYGPPRGFRYLEHVQPVFDKYCIKCHNPEGSAKKLVLTEEPKVFDPDSKKKWALSYYNLTKARPGAHPEQYELWGEIWSRFGPAKADEPNQYIDWWTRFELMKPYPAYRSGSLKSRLIKILDSGHHGVKLPQKAMDGLCAWIDLNIPYCGDYDEGNTWNPEETEYYYHRVALRKINEKINEQNIQELINSKYLKKYKKEHPALILSSWNKKTVFRLEANDTISWSYKMPGGCQDSWVLDNGHVLTSGGNKVCEVDKNGKEVWTYTSPTNVKTEIHSCQPLPNGKFLIAEGGMNRLIEVDNKGKICKIIPVKVAGNAHKQMRIARKTKRNTYVVCCEGENIVREYSSTGKTIREIKASTMKAKNIAWKAVHSVWPLDNGNLLIGGGYGATLIEIDKKNRIVWKLTPEDVPEIGLKYVSGFQRLKDGTTIITAYNSKYPIFAIDKCKNIIWRINKKELGHVTNVKVIPCLKNK